MSTSIIVRFVTILVKYYVGQGKKLKLKKLFLIVLAKDGKPPYL